MTLTVHWFSLRLSALNGGAKRSNSPILTPKKSRGLAAVVTTYESSSFTSVRSVATVTPKVVSPTGSSTHPTTSTAKRSVVPPLPGMPGK